MPKKLDLMLDIEAAGPAPDGAIVSIGWATFDRLARRPEDTAPGTPSCPCYHVPAYGRIAIDVQSCLNIGMKIDPDTVRWWLEQPEEIRQLWRKCDSASAYHIGDALLMLQKIWQEQCDLSITGEPESLVWAYPSVFDLGIIHFAACECGIKPWTWKVHSCSRSVMKALDYRRKDEQVPECFREQHKPELDAARQAIQLQMALHPHGAFMPTPLR